VRHKARVSVTNDLDGESKPFVDVVHIQLSDARAGDHSCAREKDCCSRASVVDSG
jgi:hypothetical protein